MVARARRPVAAQERGGATGHGPAPRSSGRVRPAV